MATLPLHCRECSANGQAKAMLAVTVILFVILAVALFAKTWQFGSHGPGIGTKVKIFLTHFQVGARPPMHLSRAL